MRTKIRGGWVVGFQDGHHAILPDGVVVYEDDRILHVGREFDGEVDREIDAAGKLVSPGFVNIHAVANIDVQTLALDSPQSGLSQAREYTVEGRGELAFSEERLRTSALFSLVQMLKGGATTIVEITTMAPSRFEVARLEAPILAETADQLGARIYVSHKFQSGRRFRDLDGVVKYHWDEAAGRAGLAHAREIVKQLENTSGGRVHTMLFPYTMASCSRELLSEVKQAARELDVPIHTHMSQSLFEYNSVMGRYGKTPVRLLDEIGFLDEQTILTHLLYSTLHPACGFEPGDTSDLEIVADRGTTVAHCANVYTRVGDILGSFSRYREMGINVPIGTDTFPQDMIIEMRWTAQACKWKDRDANRGTARDVFNAATIDGAKALGRDDIGRLAAGAKADIVIVNFSALHIPPGDDPIKTLVYAANGEDIETVIVDGRTVVDEGRVPGIDEKRLIDQATEAHLWQRDRFVAQHPTGQPVEVLFPSVYPRR